jgi:transcriptional regulator with XRE-family HTH domain
MEIDASFGLWLRRRRKALDLTQDALAGRVGCSVATIRKIEADERRPSRQVAELLAKVLDIPPTPLIGRDAELAELNRLLGRPECRLLTLVGPGGMGKTRLALEVAASQREAFADEVAFVSLAPVGSPEFIVPAHAELERYDVAQAAVNDAGRVAAGRLQNPVSPTARR